MSTGQIKEQLHYYVDLADARFAEALLAMLKNYFKDKKDDIVTYTAKGEILTKAQIIKEVMEAVEDVEEGNFQTTNELRKKIKNP